MHVNDFFVPEGKMDLDITVVNEIQEKKAAGGRGIFWNSMNIFLNNLFSIVEDMRLSIDIDGKHEIEDQSRKTSGRWKYLCSINLMSH